MAEWREVAREWGQIREEQRDGRTRWYLELWVDGKRHRLHTVPTPLGRRKPFSSQQDAQEHLDDLRAEYRRTRNKMQALAPYLRAGVEELLFRTHWRRFVEAKSRESISRERVRDLERLEPGGHLDPLLNVPIESLSYGVLEDWRGWLGERGLAPKTIHGLLSDVGTCLRWLVRRGDLQRAPQLPPVTVPDHVPRIPSPETVERMLAGIPWDDRGLWLARARMGLRPAEARRAQVGDYDPEARQLTVRGKGGRVRVLPVPEDVAEWIANRVLDRWGPLFRNPRTGVAWTRSTEHTVWRRMTSRLRLGDYRQNESMRHAFATHAVGRGAELALVSRFLGHTHEKTTRRYAKLAASGLVRVLPTAPNRPQTVPRPSDGPSTDRKR